MKFTPFIAMAYLAGIVAIAAPIILALNYTSYLSLREQENLAGQLADLVLRRIELTTSQVMETLQDMEDARLKDPCSASAKAVMADTLLRHDHLQALAYVRNDRIVCSSLGLENVDVGPPDYVTGNGLRIRAVRHLLSDERSSSRLATSPRSGYTAIVRSGLSLDVLQQHDEVSLGVSTPDGQPFTQIGVWRTEWAQRLGPTLRASFFDGEYIVALRKSDRYKYVAYAALPAYRLREAWAGQALLLVPLGTLAGLVLAFSVYFITRQQIGLPAQLRSALRRDDELYMVYQPVVDLQTGRWVGAEALVRWRKSTGEAIGPDLFVPVAERHQLISPLTRKVISMVARDVEALLRQRPDFVVSVNFAATDLYDDALVEHLVHVMRVHGLKPASLVIEATERTFIEPQRSRAAIQRLRAMGHRVAIDDFGTGYSSLSYLTQLEVDVLKIDRSFVEPISTEAVTAHVVDHIIEMGKSLGLRMVAEGVETETQAAYLRERGVQRAQGWLYARALHIEDLGQQLTARQA